MSESQDWCTDDLLEIIYEVLFTAADAIKEGADIKRP